MVKLIGAAIIIFSATMVGWQIAKYYAMRPQQLRSWILSLQMLETEIVYGATPLYRAFVKIGKRVQPEVGNFFLTGAELLQSTEGMATSTCWQHSLNRHWKETSLRQDEKNVLLNLGYVLGSSDREDQQKHLRLAVTQMRSIEEEARFDQSKYEKMYKSLGVLSGLLVAILML
ncbi:stage III sporulation protein SpoIIIAB [Brevibacillus sp. SYSU BS000544]|uniref:stage III sporulation protein SpoIIIAB n=1 Tax=Brevibacillus sp. SYSU BS000544 TaxID=3416443 RepID=UPI003CE5BA53